MATKFEVKYEDGTDAVYTVKPRHILAIEKANKGKGIESNIESAYRLAYLASGSEESFEAWIDTTEDINPVDDEPTPTSGA